MATEPRLITLYPSPSRLSYRPLLPSPSLSFYWTFIIETQGYGIGDEWRGSCIHKVLNAVNKQMTFFRIGYSLFVYFSLGM